MLLTYDSLLTLSEEVPYIWKHKWKLGTALYLLVRHTMTLYSLMQIILNLTNFTSLQVCVLTFIDTHK